MTIKLNTLNAAYGQVSNGKFKSVDEVAKALKSNIGSENQFAMEATGALVNKIVLQEILSVNRHSRYDDWKKFIGEQLSAGNGKYFVKKYLSGMVYDSLIGTANYLPAKKNAQGDYVVSLFPSPELEQAVSGVTKFQTQLTITQSLLISVVTNPSKLGELIALKAQETYTAFTMHIYDIVFNDIVGYFTDTTNFHGFVKNDEVSLNNYQCAHVLNLLVKEMGDYSNKFVIDPTANGGENADVFTSVNPNNMLVLCHPEVKEKFDIGTKPGIFNPKEVNFLKGIPQSNYIELPLSKYKNVYDPTGDSPHIKPSLDNTPYLDKNTIILMDKRAYAIMFQLQKTNSQAFAANDTNYITLHYSFTKDIIKFQAGAVYKSPNLCVSLSDMTGGVTTQGQ